MSAPIIDDSTSTSLSRPKLVTPVFVLGWLVTFTQYLTFYFLITVMALYAVREFAASDAGGGFAASAFVVGATFARLTAGFAVDRFGKRKVLLITTVIGTIACALYIPANSLTLLILVRLLHGFTYAFASTAVMAIVQSSIPAARRAEGTGYLALGSTLATAVGPALSLFVVGSFNYTVLFWIAFAASALGLVLAVFIRKPATDSNGGEAELDRVKVRWSIKSVLHPAVVPIGVFMLIVGLCYAGVITYINGYSEERELITGASFFFVAYAVAMLIMRTFIGRIQDKHGDNVVIYAGLVFFAVALAVMSVANADWQIIVAGALTGMGYGTLMPAAQAIAVSAVPANQIGTGISTLFLFTDLGIGLGPVFLGLLVTTLGFGFMYGLLAVGVVLAGVYYAFSHGRTSARIS